MKKWNGQRNLKHGNFAIECLQCLLKRGRKELLLRPARVRVILIRVRVRVSLIRVRVSLVSYLLS